MIKLSIYFNYIYILNVIRKNSMNDYNISKSRIRQYSEPPLGSGR